MVVDFSSYPIGTQITLTNQFGDGPTSKIMRIHVTGKATDDSTVPARLVEFEPLTRGRPRPPDISHSTSAAMAGPSTDGRSIRTATTPSRDWGLPRSGIWTRTCITLSTYISRTSRC